MLDFPTSPTIGQQFPASPIAGVPTYIWDGEKYLGTTLVWSYSLNYSQSHNSGYLLLLMV